ncbi:GNAT family N-acetyltransferase [Nonomuraea sp. NPDC049400]|uniref:GNAT family N-acetyltransferase n=1 Tax=Nonomuraea sp. NPDC049400 TaxID=3364352 RepID=UPI003794C475
MPASHTGDFLITSTSGAAALPFATVTADLFQQVFRQPPFSVNEATLARQRKYFPQLTNRPGFRLTLAQTADTYLGFGYGYLLPSDSRWWSNIVEPLDEDFVQETGGRTFAIIDYGVLPRWRGCGIGRAIHDELLAGSGAARATLAVRPSAVETQAIYRRWGWRKIGHEIMEPPAPAPEFDVLVLNQMPGITR